MGSACRKGTRRGTVVHGYPSECPDCRCITFDELELMYQQLKDKQQAAESTPAEAALQPSSPEPAAASSASSASSALSSSSASLSASSLALLQRRQPPTEPPNPMAVKIIYIKSYKVASTTVASIFQRLADERELRTATRYNAVGLRTKKTFDIIYGHNYYTYGKFNYPCKVEWLAATARQPAGWTHCGGYQEWMDEYVPNAHHLVMVAEPMGRLASMYYYERGYTKQRDRGPGDTQYERINSDSARFEDPQNADRASIQKWLVRSDFVGNKWERVQWWWLREGTHNRSLAEVVGLLDSGRFSVGLSHRVDESLLMWRDIVGLDTRDLLYTSMKAHLSHPKIHQWHPDDVAEATAMLDDLGDLAFYKAAEAAFERQIAAYGGAAKLSGDLAAWRALRAALERRCQGMAVMTEQLHVPDQVYCFLQHYDRAYELAGHGHKALGCYSEAATTSGTGRFRQLKTSPEMTLTLCLRRCRREGAALAAITMGLKCFCGDEPPSDSGLLEGACTTPCAGTKRLAGELATAATAAASAPDAQAFPPCGSDSGEAFSVYQILQHSSGLSCRCRAREGGGSGCRSCT